MNYLPLSMLNQLEYCERRFYLMHVRGEMAVNAHVLEGIYKHAKAHTAGASREGQKIIHRRVYVWSDQLGLIGFTDVVEESLERTPEGSVTTTITPVEYKKGRMGKWISDHVQLCAQAVCLEEQMEIEIEYGYIFYFGSRRRERVDFTPELRSRLLEAVARARELIPSPQPPPPIQHAAKCRDCSLEPICLPKETLKLTQ
ncbi:MAG: CRISPR-associated protein Cas4 [Chloroflexota bacterium]|nr:CRISPR-associated protein Cas4 [Chloroflexota bacterium]